MQFLKTKTKKLKNINDLVDIKIVSNLEIELNKKTNKSIFSSIITLENVTKRI